MRITTNDAVTTYANYIDGTWVPASSGDLFENRNPANTDELIGLFQKSTRADVSAAMEAAACAYEKWRLVNFVKVLEETGVPKGVVNFATGDGEMKPVSVSAP